MLKRLTAVGLCLGLMACATGGPSTPRIDMRPGQPAIDKAEANARVQRGISGVDLSLAQAYEAAIFDMALAGMREIHAGMDPSAGYIARLDELGYFADPDLFLFRMSSESGGVAVALPTKDETGEEYMLVMGFGAQVAEARDQVETRFIRESWFVIGDRMAGNGMTMDCWSAPDQVLEVCIGGPHPFDGQQTIAAEVRFVADGNSL